MWLNNYFFETWLRILWYSDLNVLLMLEFNDCHWSKVGLLEGLKSRQASWSPFFILATSEAKVLLKFGWGASVFPNADCLLLEINQKWLYSTFHKWLQDPLKFLIWKTLGQNKEFLFHICKECRDDVSYLAHTCPFQPIDKKDQSSHHGSVVNESD